MQNKLLDIMGDYFGDQPPKVSPIPTFGQRLLKEMRVNPDCPIVPSSSSEWEVVSDPNRLMKTFEFSTAEELIAFTNEVMQEQERLHHHGKLTIDHLKMIIEVYTHDVNDITEVDKEYAVAIDNILQDIMYYFASDEGYDEQI